MKNIFYSFCYCLIILSLLACSNHNRKIQVIDTHPKTQGNASRKDAPTTIDNRAVLRPPSQKEIQAQPFWFELKKDFKLQAHYHHPRVQQMQQRYINNGKYFEMLKPRMQRYLKYIVHEAKRRNMPLEVALLPVVESSLDPFAVSSSKATGMWQFIQSTGNMYGLSSSADEEVRRDIIESTRAGLDHLNDLHRQFDDWLLSMAAYNAGPGSIQRAMQANAAKGLATDYWSLSVRKETDDYVPKILALANIIDNFYAYGINLPSMDDSLSLKKIELAGTYSLSQLAACANMNFEDFYLLNPRYNSLQIANKKHTLLIPQENVKIFYGNIKLADDYCKEANAERAQQIVNRLNSRAVIKKSPATSMAPVVSEYEPFIEEAIAQESIMREKVLTPKPEKIKKLYKVQAGETLWRIAHNNQIDINDLMQWNNISDKTKIKTGSLLIIWQ